MYCNVLMLGINRRAQRAQLGVCHASISGATVREDLSINLNLPRLASWRPPQPPISPPGAGGRLIMPRAARTCSHGHGESPWRVWQLPGALLPPRAPPPRLLLTVQPHKPRDHLHSTFC